MIDMTLIKPAAEAPRFGDHVEYVGRGVTEYVGLIVGFQEPDEQKAATPVYDKNIALVARRSEGGRYTETPFNFFTLRRVEERD